MIPIVPPEFDVKQVLSACLASFDVRRPALDELKKAFQACETEFIDAERDFSEKIKLSQLHLIPQKLNIGPSVSKAEMETLYKYRFVTSDEGRHYYDAILTSAPDGKCPLCNTRQADTVDHHLPKAKFPVYAVTPIVLVPACTPCNKGKLSEHPSNSQEHSIHPYFDNIDGVNWLGANVIRSNPVTLEYFVREVGEWTGLLNDRVKNHFHNFELNDLYAFHANQELRGALRQMQRHRRNGIDALMVHLHDCYDSRTDLGINSWQAVMYQTLLNDDWFCENGIPF